MGGFKRLPPYPTHPDPSAGQAAVEGQVLEKTTFHDPCYLGRHNGVIAEPRMRWPRPRRC
jgi:hypothetical protein